MGAVQSHPAKFYKGTLCAGVALSALALVFGTSAVQAQSADALQAQIDKLQRQVNDIKQQQKQVQAAAPAAAPIVKAPGECFLRPIPGKTVSFCTPGGEFTLYGNF